MKSSPRRTVGWDQDTLLSESLAKHPKRMRLKELLESTVDTTLEEKVLAKKLM